MKKHALSQKVKELRKAKGLSQEELAKKSGLSLRTIQRVENGETEPAGETLKRISAALDVVIDELIDRGDISGEALRKTIKINKEYLHIFDDKLIISTKPEIDNLVDDYSKSMGNFLKTIMVFIISLPIFTTLAVVFYNMGKIGLALYAASFTLFFLVMAFYSMLFTSGSPVIKRDTVIKLKFKKMFHSFNIQIKYKDVKRNKIRGFIVKDDQFDEVLDALKSEGLIKDSDINYNYGKIKTFSTFIIIFGAFFFLTQISSNHLFGSLPQSERSFFGYGIYFLILSFSIILYMVYLSFSHNLNKKD